MVSVCFYFQVHQPYRIRKYSVFDIGKRHDYFSDSSNSNLNNKKILKKVAEKCYLPANNLMLELIKRYPKFKVSYSLSGVVLNQLEEHAPAVLESFKDLVKTGNVELLDETYYHSLSYLYSKEEFKEQLKLHKNKIKKLFGYSTKVFRNTELVFNNELANFIEKLGYKGILAEGAEHILGWRSPNFVYRPKTTKKIGLLLRNYKLSDDISFRFSERSWEEWPLKAEKYAHWISSHNGNGNVINLFMDYETFGEHQWEETGIFNFMKNLIKEILKHPDNDFKTPYEAISSYPAVAELDIHNFISWADIERDLSAWLSNAMQHSAIRQIYDLRDKVLQKKEKELIDVWRKLQSSDHFYYMCTKWFADGDVHKYFNPYDSPYEAYISFMNVVNDLKLRIEDATKLNFEMNNKFKAATKKDLSIKKNKEARKKQMKSYRKIKIKKSFKEKTDKLRRVMIQNAQNK